MYSITVNIYKHSQFKWQEQVLLNASTKTEAKQQAMLLSASTPLGFELISTP